MIEVVRCYHQTRNHLGDWVGSPHWYEIYTSVHNGVMKEFVSAAKAWKYFRTGK